MDCIHAFISSFTNLHIAAFAKWLALLSLLTFVLSLILLPYVIRRIPSDYFLTLAKKQPRVKDYDLKSILIVLSRNILGILLLISGIAMLFLPGQGLLTILLSVLLLDFPGKAKFITYLSGKKSIQKTINWMRKKAQKSPIKWP